jgi:hypothetical protein
VSTPSATSAKEKGGKTHTHGTETEGAIDRRTVSVIEVERKRMAAAGESEGYTQRIRGERKAKMALAGKKRWAPTSPTAWTNTALPTK